MYNLIYSIIIRPIFQEVHNFFTVCPGEPYPPSSPQYNLHNSPHYCKPSRLHKKYVLFFTYTHYPQYSHWPCTRFMHTIFCLFFSKKSYTPIYPHYPQFFSVSRRRSTFLSPPAIFCILVINFTISAKNTPFLLDKKMPKIFVG